MKVKDLQAILSKFSPDMECLLSSDSEGNGFSKLYCVEDSPATFHASGEIEVHHPDDLEDMSSAEKRKVKSALVLWPT